MKKIILGILSFVAVAATISSCQKINVAVTSEITPDSYPKTDAQFTSAEGPVFVALRNDYAVSYWFLQSCSSDEAVLPTFGPNWIDGNKYVELHRHTWTKDNAWVSASWTYLANMIGTANQTISVIRASAPAGAAKSTSLAELKTVRALAYFYMMDSFGNVPLDTLYGATTLNTNSTRAQVFTFVESELKAAIPYLKSPSASTYGLPTKYLAYSILAKMYLNAQVYTGTQRNDDCIAACDQIISSGNYSLEPMASYLQQFYPNNGPGQKEFIFAIPYDPATTSGNMFFARYDLNRNLGIRYGYSGSTPGGFTDPVMNKDKGSGLANNQPSGPRMTTAEYYAYFDDPNDIRNKQWLTGAQYWQDGTPIMVSTTNLGYDQFYTGGSPATAKIYPLVITPLAAATAPSSVRTGTGGSFDLGNDEIAWNIGIRNIKFLPDYTNTISRNQNNDVPLFRYSDIILMKAEAILRGGTPTLGATALSLVNQIKAVRTTTAALTTIDLPGIYKERCKEMAWENWHRNDMIRFGQFENTYGIGKTDADPNHRIFPIPTTALNTNSKLVQNPGY
jgi:hypothetical protein